MHYYKPKYYSWHVPNLLLDFFTCVESDLSCQRTIIVVFSSRLVPFLIFSLQILFFFIFALHHGFSLSLSLLPTHSRYQTTHDSLWNTFKTFPYSRLIARKDEVVAASKSQPQMHVHEFTFSLLTYQSSVYRSNR